VSKTINRFFLIYLLVTLPGCLSRPRPPAKTLDAAIVVPAIQTPLPPFLADVYPEPGGRVAQKTYATGTRGEQDQLFWRRLEAICVGINQLNLLGPGDQNLTPHDYVGRSGLRVRAVSPTTCNVPISELTVAEGGPAFSDERGNAIGGSFIVCWGADLVPGIYETTYEYTQTSGNVLSYTWSFEITD
jgi:hypothetical protein